MPLVVQLLAHQRLLGCRTAPEVVVQRGRQRGRRVDRPDAVARPINECVDKTHGPELAAPQAVEHPMQERARSVLGADLDHAAILAGRRHHLLSFPEVVRERLLDVDVLARLAGPDCRQRVPVVGQGNDHRVDGLVVEDPAQVRMSGHLFPAVTGRLHFAVEVRLVRVAERDDSGTGDLAEPADELVTTPAHTADRCGGPQADDPQADRLIGAARAEPGTCRQPGHSQRQTGCHRASQKAPAWNRFHGSAHHRPEVVQRKETRTGREPTRTIGTLRHSPALRAIGPQSLSLQPKPPVPGSSQSWHSAPRYGGYRTSSRTSNGEWPGQSQAAQERPALPIFYASPAAGFEQQVLTPETRSGRKPRPAHRFPMGTLRKLVAECIFWYRIRTTVGTVSCGSRDTRVVFTVSSPGRCVRLTSLDCR